MKAKLVEIRDRLTCIIALAVQPGIDPTHGLGAHVGGPVEECYSCRLQTDKNDHERWIWSRAGYGRDYEAQRKYVLLYPVDPDSASHFNRKPYDSDHGDRTITTAHRWLEQHFDEIESGAVVDVEFIRGETEAAKISDRWTRV